MHRLDITFNKNKYFKHSKKLMDIFSKVKGFAKVCIYRKTDY